MREFVGTAVILTTARVEGRVWAALHYVDLLCPLDPEDHGVCAKLVFRLRRTLFLLLEKPWGVFLDA